MTVIVGLTQEQIEAIAGEMRMIDEMAEAGTPGMLIAQVYSDHMFVGAIGEAAALGIQRVLCPAKVGSTSRSAYDRAGDKPAPLETVQ